MKLPFHQMITITHDSTRLPLYARDGRSEISFSEFTKELEEQASPFMGRPLNERVSKGLSSLIGSSLRKYRALDIQIIAAPGMKIVAARVAPLDINSIYVQWRSEFWPFKRFTQQPGWCMPLGYVDEFDLYVGFQRGLPTTLIARFGNELADYETLPVPTAIKMRALPAHFEQALERAVLTGCLTTGVGGELDTRFFAIPTDNTDW